MSIEIFNYNSILNELAKAVKMHNFYPEGHPNLETALGKCFMLIKKVMVDRGPVVMKIDVKGFHDGNNPVAPGSEELTALAKKFFFRKVKEITFTERVAQGELKRLLMLLRLEPEDLSRTGGPEAFLAENNVTGILLNEMNYESLKRLRKEIEEKKAEREREAADEDEKETAPGEAMKAAEKETPKEKKAWEEDSLETLIGKIRKETDFLRYYDQSVRIKEKTDPLIMDRRLEEAYPVLVLFLEHAAPATDLATDIKQAALDRLDEFLKYEDMLRHIVLKAGGRDESDRGAIQRLLLRGGDRAIELLLDAIVEAPDAGTRRNVFNTLLFIGKPILPFVVKRLANERWYEVRQMVSLLGEFGSPESIGPLQQAYGHPDPRVKRAVLKNLARIPSPRSVEFLMNALNEEDAQLSIQAIISLGMLRDPSAIEGLAGIALTWEPFKDEQDTKKEAIKALGIIGDRRAVEHLARILSRRTWFGKKLNEEFRSLAANSLSMIGGEEAFSAIEKAYKNSAGDLYNVCKRIIEGREGAHERNR